MTREEIVKLVLKIAERSKAKKRKVGAVIYNRHTNSVESCGCNYNPTGEPCEINNKTMPHVIHAEVAAIEGFKEIHNMSLINFKDLAIYVSFPPCDNCKKAIEDFGIETTIVVEEFMKFDKGKLQYGLIPPSALKALAKVLTYGAKKYKPNNWQKVEDPQRYVDAAMRHLEKWRNGEENDKESKLSHLDHLLTNIAFLIHLNAKPQYFGTKNDNR